MDDDALKRVLGGAVPPPDEGAKRRAQTLAVAAFEAKHEKSREGAQGFTWFDRLKRRFNTPERRRPMNRTLVLGGAATAFVTVLAAAWTVHLVPQLQPLSESGSRPAPPPAQFATVSESKGERQMGPEMSDETQPTGAAGPRSNAPRETQLAAKTGADQVMSRVRGMVHEAPAMRPSPAAEPMPHRDVVAPQHFEDVGRDRFRDFVVNPVKVVAEDPVSTFSIDVDTSSYSFVRRQLNHGILPQKDAVRVEEMVNYFDYAYPVPESRDAPFRASVAVTPCPWAEGHKLLFIGIQGYDIAPAEKPRSNLVFLLDASGSMNHPDKLPLLKTSMTMLLESLEPDDTVAVVVYAGAAGTVLEPTPVKEKAKILEALDQLSAGGSTAGGEGIRRAYQLAAANFDKDAVNRVILATDGDFNVGIASTSELQDFIERQRESGIYLSVLGFGQGNLNDQLMQALAQNGNGTAAYIDTLNEARKVLVDEASGTLFPIAKDVKVQVEFNPATVAEYRLIGYETRALNREDFRNDKVDAGELGAGHAVTAIYEITPVGGPRQVPESRYGTDQAGSVETAATDEYAFLKIRYKRPGEDTSRLITQPIETDAEVTPDLTREANWASAVAAFGQILKGGRYTGDFTYDDVIALAQANRGPDPFGYRAEFLQLVRLAKSAAAMQKQ